MTRYAATSQAQAGEIGEVFEYQLKTPVSIQRQHSAMLPILSSAIDGRRVHAAWTHAPTLPSRIYTSHWDF